MHSKLDNPTKAQRAKLRRLENAGGMPRAACSPWAWRAWGPYVLAGLVVVRQTPQGSVACITEKGQGVAKLRPRGRHTSKNSVPRFTVDYQFRTDCGIDVFMSSLFDEIKAQGLTFADVARRAQLGEQVPSNWRTQRTAPTVTNLTKVLDVLGAKIVFQRGEKPLDARNGRARTDVIEMRREG